MKTLQEQYNLLKEGKGQKDVFMKTARGQFPNLFNNLSNFDTAVKVLKQKSIIKMKKILITYMVKLFYKVITPK